MKRTGDAKLFVNAIKRKNICQHQTPNNAMRRLITLTHSLCRMRRPPFVEIDGGCKPKVASADSVAAPALSRWQTDPTARWLPAPG